MPYRLHKGAKAEDPRIGDTVGTGRRNACGECNFAGENISAADGKKGPRFRVALYYWSSIFSFSRGAGAGVEYAR